MNERSSTLPADAADVLDRAGRYARQQGSRFLLAEHLLLALLETSESAGAQMIFGLVPSVADLRLIIVVALGPPADGSSSAAVLAGSGRRVLRAALEKQAASANGFGSQHLAVALIGSDNATGAVLRALGATVPAAESLGRLLERGGAIPPLHLPRDLARFRAGFVTAQRALRTESHRERMAGNGELAVRLASRSGALQQIIASLPDDDAQFYIELAALVAPPHESLAPAPPPKTPSYTERALRLLTQLQHAAAITGRVRRAGALTTINQQLETLVFDLSHSPSREAAPLRLRMDATARFPEQAAAAWEAPALDEALNLLRLERALVAERGVDSTFLALNTIIDALKSLPEDEDGGEAASVPAWPPPKPPFRMGAEQRLDA